MEYGLEPVIDADCRILILGSFPSVKSRGYFYYGHPQNRFWRTLSDILGSPVPAAPEDKRKWLLANRIALWDIVARCEIKGSSDANIRVTAAEINDIPSVLAGTRIGTVFCNGTKSAELCRRFFPAIETVLLPSTSRQRAVRSGCMGGEDRAALAGTASD